MSTDENLRWRPLSEGAPAGYLKVVSRLYRYPDGRTDTWDILLGGSSVAALALTDDEQVVLARQFRPGPGAVLLELPGGLVEDGEDVVDAALRELREETGYTAASADLVMQTYLASYATQRRHAVVARGCARAGEPRLDPGEFIEPILMPIDDFVPYVLTGRLTDTDLALAALVAAGYLQPTTRPHR
ncbi:ADP-ribose pyrophosphatase [Actinocorallia herbida]|uniref:ADP-ribose pyrophosphatase n=1 Tax=Actinocorallia herbida TaxID=58109 RepID=A0A3N1D0G6_9ACTN|nr:NUDIX hydrolase [Actinocorallia herbida]ROO87025.1 ADP-ribose pyrophosphatase [Actinocorallia herbida]